MQTGTTLDWQIFEEREWDDAVAAGLIAKPQASDPVSALTQGGWREWQARLAGVIAIVLVGLLLGMAYPAWQAAGMGVETQPEAHVLVADEAPNPAIPPTQNSDADWGPRLTVVTDHFRIEAHQRDLPVVTQIAADIDTRYRKLRRTLGLAAPTSSLSIAVAPHPITTGWRLSGDQLLIASPYFVSTPAASLEAALTCLLQKPLTHVLIIEAVDDEMMRWQWTFMVAGLRHWLQRCPAADLQPAAHGAKQGLSAYNLTSLLFADADWVMPADQTQRIEAATSLIEYIVHRYGEDRLPSLLDAFGRHNRWHTLAPELFGVSATDLEEGWQEYVKR
jgi:hypothetical protein